jgi:hypothetical protein
MDTKKLVEKYGDTALPPRTFDAPEVVVGYSQDVNGVPINFPLSGGEVFLGYQLFAGISQQVPTRVGDLKDLTLERGSAFVTITTGMLEQAYYQGRTAAGAFSHAQTNGVKNGRAFISFLLYDQDGKLVAASDLTPIRLALPQSTTE